MDENMILAMIVYALFIGLILNAIWQFFKINTTFMKSMISNKILIYLLSEISYDDKYYEKFIKNYKEKNEDVLKVPTMLIIKSIFIKIRMIIFKQLMLFSGVFLFFLIISIFLVKIPYFNLYTYFFITLCLFIIMSYISTATINLSIYENNISNLQVYIRSLNLIKSEEEKESLLDEIKVDFDLHKNHSSIYLLIFPFIIWIIINFTKIELFIGDNLVIPFLILIFIWTAMNFIYRTYKSDVIYITYQALNRYKIEK
jgi:hypothetical protein